MTDQKHRFDAFWSGVKEGSKKELIDKIVSKISDPIADIIILNLHEKFPHLSHLAPTVKAISSAATLMLIAEALGMALPLIDNSPLQNKKDKIEFLESYLRVYAGEKTAKQILELIWSIIPSILDVFSEVTGETNDTPFLLEEETRLDDFAPPPLLKEELIV